MTTNESEPRKHVPERVAHEARRLVEELANAVTHGVGLVAAAIALPALVYAAFQTGDPWRLAGALAFGTTAFLLFAASTLYHALPPSRAKRAFRVIDHAAIYVLIAGTYTPFTIAAMGGPWGWTLFVVVWSLAALGIALKSTARFRDSLASTVLYLAMGWSALVAIRPLTEALHPAALAWLVAGGIVYTAGMPFYASKRPYSHAVWHLFVLGGAVCHFIAVLDTTT